MTDLTEGAPAPDFDLETPDGRVKLADFAGGTVVLYFYPKDDTTGCTKEAQVGSSRVDLQACKLEYSIVSPK